MTLTHCNHLTDQLHPLRRNEFILAAPDAPSQTIYAVHYQVESTTFSLNLLSGETPVPVSLPSQTRRVENLTEEKNETSWDYPDNNVSVSIKPKKDYLQVTIQSTKKSDNSFSCPKVSGEEYYLPIGEGKRIPRKDIA